jgi:hypothetical protein
MKRKALGVTSILVVIIVALGLFPAPALATGQAFHYSYVGKGADAGWTTCPSQPGPNVVCTDTWISVGEQVYKEDGTKFPSSTLFLYQYSYKFDRKGNWIFVSENNGSGEATLSVGKQLADASASATVALTTCTADRRGNYTCQDGGWATVSASWTGQGDLTRSNYNYRVQSGGYTYIGHSRGTSRDATAVAQVNGGDIGTGMYGSIFESRWRDVYITH